MKREIPPHLGVFDLVATGSPYVKKRLTNEWATSHVFAHKSKTTTDVGLSTALNDKGGFVTQENLLAYYNTNWAVNEAITIGLKSGFIEVSSRDGVLGYQYKKKQPTT